jgi:taurine dehydrogenase large subunit
MPYDPLTAASPGIGLDYMPSYWTATAGAAPPDDGPLHGTTEVDVAIVGGGYTGLSCAYRLAHDYGSRAMVLEANRPGWGCSGRNGGFARAAIGRHSFGKMLELWGRDTARRVFGQALAAVENLRCMMREGAIACDAREVGHLKIAHRPSRAAALAAEAELLQREFEYPAEFLSAAHVRAEHIGGAQSHGAMRFPDAIAVHPLKLAFGVLDMARSAGAKVHTHSPVLNWTKRGHTHVLQTPTAEIRARTVVLATNGYTSEHLHDCLHGTTLPVLSHIIVTRPMTAEEKAASAFVTEHVLTDTRNLLYYWRRLPDDRILFGGRGRIVETSAGQRAHRDFLLAELKRKLPPLDVITIDYDWWGWVCLTADFLPHVHRAANDASVHYAIGYQGSGVSYALYAGRIMASRIANAACEEPIPATANPLPRFPLAALRRVGQRALYQWYRYSDNRG